VPPGRLPAQSADLSRPVAEALVRLGVKRLVLGIHASSFPAGPADFGYGSPYGPEGKRLFEFARRLGFNGVQLGPSGEITEPNLSPYDGTTFSRNVLTADLLELSSAEWGRLLDEDECRGATADDRRTDHRRARAFVESRLRRAARKFREQRTTRGAPLFAEFLAFRASAEPWLERDVLYRAVSEQLRCDDPALFPPEVRLLFQSGDGGAQRRKAARAALDEDAHFFEFAQFVVHRQHARMRSELAAKGLALFADLQVGYSHRDRYIYDDAFEAGWLLGAPPSRTNPGGQPWGYPILKADRRQDRDSPARSLLRRRFEKIFAEHDGVRIDHPHGLVCPWVYRAGANADPCEAVRSGTRLFESPDSDDPDLRRWAIARTHDLTRLPKPRWDDRWVERLDDAQVARYATFFDLLLEVAREYGRDVTDIACEILSTCPHPLERVLLRHGLGRFVVTEKADPTDPVDPYRSDGARREDWIMLGTHDTPPFQTLVDRWIRGGDAAERAAYLAERLVVSARDRSSAIEAWSQSPAALTLAHFADLFVSRAGSVYVFFGDLFGEREPFNRAGIVHPDNWTLRMASDFEGTYETRCASGAALDVPRALAMALRARGADGDGLAGALEEPRASS
jgi:4-alpha-glucanotransferase